MEERTKPNEVLPELVPPTPSGGPTPEKFVRTLPGDMSVVAQGGKPDLAPLAPVLEPAAPPLPEVSHAVDAPVPAPEVAPSSFAAPEPVAIEAPSSLAASPLFGEHDLALPSKKRQSWGAILSVIIIVVMIIVGAFYAWGQRIAAQYHYPASGQ